MNDLETFIKLKNELPSYKHIFSEIEKSEKEYIDIAFKKQTCTLFDSKIGGYPYVTNINEYPKNLKGEYLELLAQVNFEQMPHLEGFPSKGILQIFVLDEEGSCYGMNFDDPCLQDNFRIYAHSYSSWERGSNEHTNKMIRRFIPKGTDISQYTEKEIKRIERWINNYPRKLFNYATAEMIYNEKLNELPK